MFVAFAGEEQGLLGSTLFAKKAKDTGMKIEAVLNNDIIGSDIAGDGRTDNHRLNVFSEDPQDSPSRQLARYIREIGERYVPAMNVDPVFRADRFGRGGDHTPFNLEGFAAVRFSTPTENFANQHSITDTFANTSPAYTTRVIKINAAAAASLAWAPKSPATSETVERNGRKMTNLLLTRGKTRYEALLKWKNESPEPDLAGYVVLDPVDHGTLLGTRDFRRKRDRIHDAGGFDRRPGFRRQGDRQGRQREPGEPLCTGTQGEADDLGLLASRDGSSSINDPAKCR